MADEEQSNGEQESKPSRSERKKSDKHLDPLSGKIKELETYCETNKEQYGFGSTQKAIYAERADQLKFLKSLKG